MFITFEGGECSGKSTQSRMLYEWCEKNNVPAILTREPGGTESAEKIRDILLNKSLKLENKSQLLLHFASRIEHVQDVIRHGLESGKIVICDRFVDSTIAYQHYASGLPLELISIIHKNFLDNLQPDITFLMNISPDEFKIRISAKHQKQANDDRYEDKSEEFHLNVIKGFLEIAKQNTHRCHILNSVDDIETNHQRIIDIVSSKIN